MDVKRDVSLPRRINLIFRFSYTLPFFMASVCGSLFAFLFYNPPVHVVILMPVVVLLLAVFVNFSNDYFDHKSGVDKIRFMDREEMAKALDSELLKKIYWEGNPFDDGLINDKQGRYVMALLLVLAGAFAIPVFLHGGLIVILFGGMGVFLSYFYTAPPLDLGARGLGEINVAVSFFMLVFCSFYVATTDLSGAEIFMFGLGIFNAEIFIFAMIIGTLVGLMRLTDSMSGQEAHIMRGEKSISVRFGLDGAVKIAKAFIVFGYILFAVMVLFNPLYALLFLTLPLTFKVWKIMSEKSDNWTMKIPPFFFGTAFMAEIFFVVAVFVIYVFDVQPLISFL